MLIMNIRRVPGCRPAASSALPVRRHRREPMRTDEVTSITSSTVLMGWGMDRWLALQAARRR
jgi:hypothetical protein